MQFLAIYLYVTAVGFVTAGVLASFVQLVSGEPMRFGDEPKSLLPSIGGVLLRVLAGPMAGAVTMPYRRFLLCNLAGALLWACSMVSLAWLGGRWIPIERMLGGVVQFGLGALLLVALLVLLPETVSALRAARRNELQKSLNLALGSSLATIGLTIPAVAIVSLVLGLPLALGIGAKAMTLLALSLFVTTISLGTGRTTILQGVVHLVIFAAYLFTTVVP